MISTVMKPATVITVSCGRSSQSGQGVPVSAVPNQKTKMKQPKGPRERHYLTERNSMATPKMSSGKSQKSNNSKYFMSPENCHSTKKCAGKKERTPRSTRKMQKQHRDNERNRHQGMNAIIQDLSKMVPGHGLCGKETKIHTLRKLIAYIRHLEDYSMELITELGLDADFHDLMLLPNLTEHDLEMNRYVPPIQKLEVKSMRKRPAEEYHHLYEMEKVRKLSSPTIDSTTIEPPACPQLGQAFIQLENGKMAPLGSVKQSEDGSNYITIPEIVTTSEMYRGGTILIPSVMTVHEFQNYHKMNNQKISSDSPPVSPIPSKVLEPRNFKQAPTSVSAAFGSPVSFSPFSSPEAARTPFLRNTGEATPLLSQTSISAFNSPEAWKSPYTSFFSQGSDSGTPSKMVDSTTMTTFASQSELSMPLQDQDQDTENEDPHPLALVRPNYLSGLSLIRNERQDVVSYAAEYSDYSFLDDDQLDDPLFYGSYKKKKKQKLKKKKKSQSRKKPASADGPFMFYGVGKYVNENRCSGHKKIRKSNNSAAATLFSENVGSSMPYEWKFHDNTAELIRTSSNDDAAMPISAKSMKPDQRKTSWMNGFMMFSRMHRRDFINVNPGTPTSQISKLLGQSWRDMEAEQQEPYKLKAKQYADYLARMYDIDSGNRSPAITEDVGNVFINSESSSSSTATSSHSGNTSTDTGHSVKQEFVLENKNTGCNSSETDETKTCSGSDCEDQCEGFNDCTSNSTTSYEETGVSQMDNDKDGSPRLRIEMENEDGSHVPSASVFHAANPDADGVVPLSTSTVSLPTMSPTDSCSDDFCVPNQEEHNTVASSCAANSDNQRVPCRRLTEVDGADNAMEIVLYGVEIDVNEAEE